ncbi:uncharacterized protein DUF982 [Neorhizobium alkalisoli]|uniref:Uncharacterized protein DUF982 n=1 Tax=Neorhizobium alkalisoli TaxID=528178 RepID=A0A561R6I3_9HYPH|nr:uncharacterized protein DUF982 [Neorhizobium alkalisoli]
MHPLKGYSLNSVIPVGFSLQWEFVVFVKEGLRDKAITGPRQALNFLLEDFDIQAGAHYRAAVSDCRQALCYRCDIEVARTSFIIAYAEYMVKTEH